MEKIQDKKKNEKFKEISLQPTRALSNDSNNKITAIPKPEIHDIKSVCLENDKVSIENKNSSDPLKENGRGSPDPFKKSNDKMNEVPKCNSAEDEKKVFAKCEEKKEVEKRSETTRELDLNVSFRAKEKSLAYLLKIDNNEKSEKSKENTEKETDKIADESPSSSVSEENLYNIESSSNSESFDILKDSNNKPIEFEDSVLRECVHTSILNKYAYLKPTGKRIDDDKVLEPNRPENKICLVSLSNGKKLVHKTIVKKQKENKEPKDLVRWKKARLESIKREFFIGRTFGKYSKCSVKYLDLAILETKNDEVKAEMLIKYGGTSLDNMQGLINHKKLLEIISQLIDAAVIMERVGITHLDIKPQNIVWNKAKKILKIIDFGTSIVYYQKPESITQKIGNSHQKITALTQFYAPPEMIQLFYKSESKESMETHAEKLLNEKIIPQKVDVFCFGMTLAKLILGSGFEFDKKITKTQDELSEICSLVQRELSKLPVRELQSIILPCLSYNPTDRPTFAKIKRDFANLTIVKDNLENTTGIYDKKERIIRLDPKEGEFNLANMRMKDILENPEITNDDKTIIIIQISLAYTNAKLENHIDADYYLRRALELLEKAFKEDSLKKVVLYNEIGITYFSLHKYKEANIYFEKSMYSLNKLDKTHITNKILNQVRAAIFNNEAISCYCICDYQKAADLHKDSLKIILKNTENKLDIALSYNNISNLYYRLSKFYEAEICMNNAIKFLGDDLNNYKSILPTFYSNLAFIYSQFGKFENVLEIMKKAKSIVEEMCGEDKPELIALHNNMGENWVKMGNMKEAIKMHKKAISICKKQYGENDNKWYPLLYFLSIAYIYKGKYAKSVNYSLKAYEILKKGLEFNHVFEAKICIYLGQAYNKQNKYDESLKYSDIALKILNKIYNDAHIDKALVLNNFGQTYAHKCEYDLAKKFFKDSIKNLKAIFKNTNYQFIASYNGLGLLNYCQNKFEKAIYYYLKSYSLCKLYYKERHINLGETLLGLANTFSKMKLLEEAQLNFNKCIDEWSHINNGKHPIFVTVYESMAIFYNEKGDSDKLKECLQKASDMKKSLEKYYS